MKVPKEGSNQFSTAYLNPSSGSVIYCELASNNEIDFFLVTQKTEKTEKGTVTPTQYKLVYYHPENTPQGSGF